MLTGDVPFHGENQVAVAMKHVRDELPDVQLRRPEVSSALAAVVDRATTKDVDRRYADSRELIDDLEDVLAIETARSGQATGEATAVIRTLPSDARRRLPLRMRHGVRWAAGLLLLGGDRRRRRALRCWPTAPSAARRAPATSRRPPKTVALSLAQANAHDYDPVGRRRRAPRPGEVRRRRRQQQHLVDRGLPGRRRSTASPAWGSTSIASPSVSARVMDVNTPTPGWVGGIYTAKGTNGVPKDIKGWTELAKIPKREVAQPDPARHGGQPLPLLPRLDHQAAARRRPREDLRDPPVPLTRPATRTNVQSVSTARPARAEDRSTPKSSTPKRRTS